MAIRMHVHGVDVTVDSYTEAAGFVMALRAATTETPSPPAAPERTNERTNER